MKNCNFDLGIVNEIDWIMNGEKAFRIFLTTIIGLVEWLQELKHKSGEYPFHRAGKIYLYF